MLQLSNNNRVYRGVGILVVKNAKVLLGRRIGIRGNGTYGLPGGFKKNNESYLDCAKRELGEETGLIGLMLFPIVFIHGSVDNYYFVDKIYYTSCNESIPQVKEPDKVEEWNWYEFSNLPVPLYLPTQLAINAYALKLKNDI